jgi:hypothetical protein
LPCSRNAQVRHLPTGYNEAEHFEENIETKEQAKEVIVRFKSHAFSCASSGNEYLVARLDQMAYEAERKGKVTSAIEFRDMADHIGYLETCLDEYRKVEPK